MQGRSYECPAHVVSVDASSKRSIRFLGRLGVLAIAYLMRQLKHKAREWSCLSTKLDDHA
jgi:hypothetical protein